MAIFNFSRAEKDAIIQKIGQFEAGSLLTFFAEEIGPYFYNKGLHDAEAILRKRLDEIAGALGKRATSRN